MIFIGNRGGLIEEWQEKCRSPSPPFILISFADLKNERYQYMFDFSAPETFQLKILEKRREQQDVQDEKTEYINGFAIGKKQRLSSFLILSMIVMNKFSRVRPFKRRFGSFVERRKHGGQ